MFYCCELKVLNIKLKANIMLLKCVPKYKSTSILEPCIFQRGRIFKRNLRTVSNFYETIGAFSIFTYSHLQEKLRLKQQRKIIYYTLEIWNAVKKLRGLGCNKY